MHKCKDFHYMITGFIYKSLKNEVVYPAMRKHYQYKTNLTEKQFAKPSNLI